MDDTDLLALQLLAQHGRMSWSDLAAHLKLSGPATAERVRRLEEKGVIAGYAALVNREAVAYGLTAFVGVDLSDNGRREEFLARMMAQQEILECHHVTGDHDYLLKVACKSPQHLDQILNDVLKVDNLVSRTRTTIVLGTPKEQPFIPG